MKIYYEDGKLIDIKDQTFNVIIDVNLGTELVITMLNWYKENIPDAKVYTNSLMAFSNKYAWNDDLKVPEIYIRTANGFVRIDELTDRELRYGHNLAKMFISGEFKPQHDSGDIDTGNYIITIKAIKDLTGNPSNLLRYAGVDNGPYGSGYAYWHWNENDAKRFPSIESAEKWFEDSKKDLFYYVTSDDVDPSTIAVREIVFKKMKSLS